MKRLKYGNRKTVIDNFKFDSKKEAERYVYLKVLLTAGEVTNLMLQPKFDIVINGFKVCYYQADFSYRTKDGEDVVEDVKSSVTSKNPVYRLKKKLLKAVHGIDVKEV